MYITELKNKLIVSSGDSLIIHDSKGDQVVKIPPAKLPLNLTKGQTEVLNNQDRSINCLSTSRDHQRLVVSTENKQVIVFNTNFEVESNFIVGRTPSKVLFTSDGDILVADRTGDVYLYKLNDVSEPQLLLGHLSMILDMTLSQCDRYIVTCDRDEKIRVSHFPNTYNIVSYCLGHEEFVTNLKVVQDILLSASGDGTVKIWNYLKGDLLNTVNVYKYVDHDLIEKFSHIMDIEKVDVNVLPITDMQVHLYNNNLIVVISLYNCNSILIFKISLEDYKYELLKQIECVSVTKKCYLTSANLYVFDNEHLASHKFVNGNFCPDEQQNKLVEFFSSFRDSLKINDNNEITVLYKRKFDNVQEYLERKKQRLESNK